MNSTLCFFLLNNLDILFARITATSYPKLDKPEPKRVTSQSAKVKGQMSKRSIKIKYLIQMAYIIL